MSGFLDPGYGVTEARRAKRIKLIAVSSVTILVVAGFLFFTFRNWRQERVVNEFLALLKQQKYQDAYQLWGCTQETPCKYYPPEKFNEDWGPTGQYKDAGSAKIENEDVCGSGVIFAIAVPKIEPFGLWVESSTNILGFAPNGWARCPGAHLHLLEYLKSFFK
jgi:hypothetical protein